METVRLTKKFTFEMAHALYNYEGACRNIHGHSYILEICVKGLVTEAPNEPDDGFLIDFGDLKRIAHSTIIEELDHSLILSENTNPELTEVLKNQFDKVITVPYNPTCENLIRDFAGRIKTALPQQVKLHSLKLHETATAYCEWYANDNS